MISLLLMMMMVSNHRLSLNVRVLMVLPCVLFVCSFLEFLFSDCHVSNEFT